MCITYVFFSIEAPGALLTLLLSLSFFLQVWSKCELLFLHGGAAPERWLWNSGFPLCAGCVDTMNTQQFESYHERSLVSGA